MKVSAEINGTVLLTHSLYQLLQSEGLQSYSFILIQLFLRVESNHNPLLGSPSEEMFSSIIIHG